MGNFAILFESHVIEQNHRCPTTHVDRTFFLKNFVMSATKIGGFA